MDSPLHSMNIGCYRRRPRTCVECWQGRRRRKAGVTGIRSSVIVVVSELQKFLFINACGDAWQCSQSWGNGRRDRWMRMERQRRSRRQVLLKRSSGSPLAIWRTSCYRFVSGREVQTSSSWFGCWTRILNRKWSGSVIWRRLRLSGNQPGFWLQC